MELRGMNYQTGDKRPLTKEERAAKKEQSRKDAQTVLAARKKADDAFRANFERLRAERLAREAAGNLSGHSVGDGSTPDNESPAFGWGDLLHRTDD
jgi:hypothetical protein